MFVQLIPMLVVYPFVRISTFWLFMVGIVEMPYLDKFIATVYKDVSRRRGGVVYTMMVMMMVVMVMMTMTMTMTRWTCRRGGPNRRCLVTDAPPRPSSLGLSPRRRWFPRRAPPRFTSCPTAPASSPRPRTPSPGYSTDSPSHSPLARCGLRGDQEYLRVVRLCAGEGAAYWEGGWALARAGSEGWGPEHLT
jgi:hypothetical protein